MGAGQHRAGARREGRAGRIPRVRPHGVAARRPLAPADRRRAGGRTAAGGIPHVRARTWPGSSAPWSWASPRRAAASAPSSRQPLPRRSCGPRSSPSSTTASSSRKEKHSDPPETDRRDAGDRRRRVQQRRRDPAGAAARGGRGRHGRAAHPAARATSSSARSSRSSGSRSGPGWTASSSRGPSPRARWSRRGQVLYRLERVRYDAAYRSAAARLANARRTGGAGWSRCSRARRSPSRTWTTPAPSSKRREGGLRRGPKGPGGRRGPRRDRRAVGRTQLEVGARVTGPADLLTTIEQVNPVYVTFRPSSQDQQRLAAATSEAARLVQPGSDARGEGGPARRHRGSPRRAARLRESVGGSRHRHPGAARLVRQPTIARWSRASSSGSGSAGSSATARSRCRGARCSSRSTGSSCSSSARATPSRRATSRPAPGAATGGSSRAGSRPVTGSWWKECRRRRRDSRYGRWCWPDSAVADSTVADTRREGGSQ